MTQQNPLNQGVPDEFELMRRRLRRRGAVQGQEQQRDLSRQFAALGTAPSGAAIKARQQAAQAQERITSEGLQDVNILEAQTRRGERENLAQRELQKELQQRQLGFQEREGLAQRELQRDLQEAQIAGQFELAQLSATTDLEKARMAGATQIELQEMQNETLLKERQLVEAGTDRRLAKQLASSREMFDIEQAFREEQSSIQEDLAERGMSIQEQEFKINQTITALNSIDVLIGAGFGQGEIGAIIAALELPFQDKLGSVLERKFAGDIAARQELIRQGTQAGLQQAEAQRIDPGTFRR
ncbi:hypothetical protein CMI37_20830 [Candidatus Pacearchaeota archaeon]|nr:hypothetical protein [Candidatus Pacearchaeota archaeon]|tara:strand:+ start:14287 stop:15183 length:897 start_codon:yes stop_codon:yes gene_type:complete